MKQTTIAFGIATLLACGSTHAAAPKIVTAEFMVPAGEPGIALYVRNKHPAEMRSVRAERILLYVHGSTFPSETTFDLKLDGISWMDYIAQRGYDVYMMDVRGYGRSTRPPEMDVSAELNEPIVRTQTAVADVSATVDFILKRRQAPRLNLLGWSWGTSLVGSYTAQHNDRVVKLVLYAPTWTGSLPPGVIGAAAKLGAYRWATGDGVRNSWLGGVPEPKRADLIPPGWFEAFVGAMLASDPAGSSMNPPKMRAPNGAMADHRDFWNAGKPLYNPGDIRVPTLLTHGEWDAIYPNELLYGYFAQLVNTPYKRYIQIGESTHFIMIEKNRMELFQAVQQFLDEEVSPGQ